MPVHRIADNRAPPGRWPPESRGTPRKRAPGSSPHGCFDGLRQPGWRPSYIRLLLQPERLFSRGALPRVFFEKMTEVFIAESYRANERMTRLEELTRCRH